MPADRPSSGRRLPMGLMVVGSEMATFTILGLALDFGLGTMPGFTIGLTLCGLGIAFFHLTKMAKAMAAPGPNSQNRRDANSGPDGESDRNGERT